MTNYEVTTVRAANLSDADVRCRLARAFNIVLQTDNARKVQEVIPVQTTGELGDLCSLKAVESSIGTG